MNGGGKPAVPPPTFSFPFVEALLVDIEFMIEAVVVVFLVLVAGPEEAEAEVDGMVMVVVDPDAPFFVFACSR